MKVRTTIAGAGLSAVLTVTGCGAMTILVSAAVSGCSGSSTPTGSTSFSTPATTPPTPSIVNTTPATTPPASPSPSNTLPTAAPATGGGGTAGLEDVPLFLLGGAAVLAGAGSLAYRRKVMRKH